LIKSSSFETVARGPAVPGLFVFDTRKDVVAGGCGYLDSPVRDYREAEGRRFEVRCSYINVACLPFCAFSRRYGIASGGAVAAALQVGDVEVHGNRLGALQGKVPFGVEQRMIICDACGRKSAITTAIFSAH